MRTAIVFFATHWGPIEGGINAFNFDFVSAVSHYHSEQFQCVAVIENNSLSNVEVEAQNPNIKFVWLEDLQLSFSSPSSAKDVYEHLKNVIAEKVHCWVGHDTVTGPFALAIKKFARQGFAAVFHHMNYGAYESSKNMLTGTWKEKVLVQHQTLENADIILAVGPKLLNSAKDILTNSTRKTVQEIIPGLSRIIRKQNPPINFSVIVFGRLSDRLETVKQGKLAVDAFASAVKANDDTLTLIGVDTSELRTKYIQSAQSFSRQRFALNISSEITNRQELFSLLTRHTACLMLSTHEGFGLVGWEAIAAEVPLVISKNSGLYELLSRELTPRQLGWIYPVDIRGNLHGDEAYNQNDLFAVTKAISDIRRDKSEFKTNAKKLREALLKFTWETAAKKFIKAILGHAKKALPDVLNLAEPLQFTETPVSVSNVSIDKEIIFDQTSEVPRSVDMLEAAYPRREITLISKDSDHRHKIYYELFKVKVKKGTILHFLFLGPNTNLSATFKLLKSSSFLTGTDLTICTPRIRSKKTGGTVDRLKSIMDATSLLDNECKIEISYIDEFIWEYCLSDDLKETSSSVHEEKNYIDQKLYYVGWDSNDLGMCVDYFRKSLSRAYEEFDSENVPVSIILGSGGMGKSTFCDIIVNVINSMSRKRAIYISSRDFLAARGTYSGNIHSIVELYAAYRSLDDSSYSDKYMDPAALELNLSCGNVVLVIDGLDEIESMFKEQFDLAKFIDSIMSLNREYDNCRIIITSRDFHKDRYFGRDGIDLFYINGFDSALAESYFNKRFSKQTEFKTIALDHLSQLGLSIDGKYMPLVLNLLGDMVEKGLLKTGKISDSSFKFSDSYLKPEFPLDRIMYHILSREIEKQSLDITINDFFGLLVDIVVEKGGMICKSDFDLYINVYFHKGICDVLDFTQFYINPLFEIVGDNVQVKYEVVSNLVKTRFFQSEFNGGIHSLNVIDVLAEFYDGKGVLLGDLIKTTNAETQIFLEAAKAMVHTLVEKYNIISSKPNGTQLDIERIKRSISGLLYFVFLKINDPDPSRRTGILNFLYQNNLRNIYVFGNFFSFDFTKSTIFNSSFYNYSNLPSCIFPKDTKVFFDCSFTEFKLDGIKEIPSSVFDDSCRLPGTLRLHLEQQTETSSVKFQTIKDDLRTFFSSFILANTFQPKTYNKIKSSFKSKLQRKDFIEVLTKSDIVSTDDARTTFYSVNRKYRDSVLTLHTQNILDPTLEQVVNGIYEQYFSSVARC